MPEDQTKLSDNLFTVIRYKDDHVFVYDPSIQTKVIPHKFFDLHETRWRGFDPKHILRFPRLPEVERQKALELYLEWKKNGDSEFVQQQAAILFCLREPQLPVSPIEPGDSNPGEPEHVGCKIEQDKVPSFNFRAVPVVGSQKQEVAKKEATKKTNAQKIQEYSQLRQIKRLVHFTNLQNLSSILEYGLLSRTGLEIKPYIHFLKNDDQRLDGHLNSISLSISFPNYKMFHINKKDSPEAWAVIALQPEILWDLDCAFCNENAASNNERSVPLYIRKQSCSFEGMFADFGQVKRSQLNIPDWFTTNPQAEVLVFNSIPPRYIMKIYFHDHKAKDNWFKANPSVDPDLLAVDIEYFSARCDYVFWQNQTKGVDSYIEYPDEIPF